MGTHRSGGRGDSTSPRRRVASRQFVPILFGALAGLPLLASALRDRPLTDVDDGILVPAAAIFVGAGVAGVAVRRVNPQAASRVVESLRLNLVALPFIALAVLLLQQLLSADGATEMESLIVTVPFGAIGLWVVIFILLGFLPAADTNETRRALLQLRHRHQRRIDRLASLPAGWGEDISAWIARNRTYLPAIEDEAESVPFVGLDTGLAALTWSRIVSSEHRDLLELLGEEALASGRRAPAARQWLLAYLRETRYRLDARRENLEKAADEAARPGPMKAIAARIAPGMQSPPTPKPAPERTWLEAVMEELKTLEDHLATRPTEPLPPECEDTVRKLPTVEESIDGFIHGSEERLMVMGRDLLLSIFVTGTVMYLLLTLAVHYGAPATSIAASVVFFLVGVGGGQLSRLRPTNDLETANVPTYAVPRLALLQGALVSGFAALLSVLFIPVIEALADADLTLVSAGDQMQAPAASPVAMTFDGDATPEPGAVAIADPSQPASSGESDPTEAAETGDDERVDPTLAEVYSFSNAVGYLLAFGFGLVPGLFFRAVEANISSIATAIGSLNAVLLKRPGAA